MTPKTKKEWEKLAEGAMSAGLKVAAKGAKKNNAPFEDYEDSRWDLLKSYQKSGWIAAAKFIAKKLSSK